MIKKIIFCAVLAWLVLLGHRKWEKYSKLQRKFIKEETVLNHLNRATFFAKLKSELPNWAKDQINEDFEVFEKQGITKAQVDVTFASIRNKFPHPFYVRYRVVDNQLYRYIPEGEKIPLINNSMEKALKTLIELTGLEDTDFILAFEDGVPLQGIPDQFYFAPTTDLQAPLLISAKRQGTPYAILVPDWRSIGEWWAHDVKNILSVQQQTSWDKKKEKAIWRGGLTREARLTFCEMAQSVTTLIDAKINSCDPSRITECQDRGVMGDRVSWEEYLDYKYQPILDGVMCAAPALQWRLLSNCVTLKQDSDEIQWFYGALKPYVHYIPFKNDFSNVVQQIEWAKAHDLECLQMAEQSTEFAQNNIMLEDNFIYFLHVLKRYASLQKLNRSEIEQEIKSNSRWINIQNYRSLRKQAKQNQMNGFIMSATPY